jgi:hypothetical protein
MVNLEVPGPFAKVISDQVQGTQIFVLVPVESVVHHAFAIPDFALIYSQNS